MNSNLERTLIVAAHPDDEILGCGGLIKKLTKKNKKVKVIFLAEGSSCRFKIEDLYKSFVQKEITHREGSARKALKVLGVKNFNFYNLKCGRLHSYPISDVAKIVEKEISSFKPTAIFTHSDKDVHVDHRTVFQACLQATRPAVSQKIVKELYSFEILSSTEWKYDQIFEPNLFFDINMEIKAKIKALKEYKSELRPFPHPRSVEGVKILSKFRGMQSGFKFAEAFKLIRSYVK